MLYADLVQDAKELGSLSASALLGLGLIVFAGAVIYLFKRSEKKDADSAATVKELMDKSEKRMDEAQTRHEKRVDEQRQEHTQAMGKLANAMKAVADESRAHAEECRENIQLVHAGIVEIKESLKDRERKD